MAENKLENEHKIFIVKQFAVFERPKAIKARLKEIYDVELSIQGIHHYNPAHKELSKELKKIFNTERRKFLKDSSLIPIAGKNYRLQKLQNMFDAQEDAAVQNTVAMRDILEQAAKETGDVFTNKQKVENSGEVRHSVVRLPAKIAPEEWLKRSKQPITE